MAEVQTIASAGETTLRFIEFVRMQAHSISLCLGRIPHPQTKQPQINLGLARVLLDQLAAIATRTTGNLTPEESTVLNGTLAQLQAACLEAAASSKPDTSPPSVPQPSPLPGA